MALTNDDKEYIKDIYSDLQAEDRKFLEKSMKDLQAEDRKFLEKSMKDLQAEDRKFLEKLLEDVVDYKLEEKIKEYVGNLPTRDEFNTRMDELMGEMKTVREEQVLLSQHSSDHSDHIEKLEKIHPKNSHAHLFA